MPKLIRINQDYDSIRVNLSEAIQRDCYKTIFIRHSEDTCLVASNDFKKIVAKFLHETIQHDTYQLITVLNQP